ECQPPTGARPPAGDPHRSAGRRTRNGRTRPGGPPAPPPAWTGHAGRRHHDRVPGSQCRRLRLVDGPGRPDRGERYARVGPEPAGLRRRAGAVRADRPGGAGAVRRPPARLLTDSLAGSTRVPLAPEHGGAVDCERWGMRGSAMRRRCTSALLLGSLVGVGGLLAITSATADEPESDRPSYVGRELYAGELHSHTSVSDGVGLPGDAFEHVADETDADFFTVSEHDVMWDLRNGDDFVQDWRNAESEEWRWVHEQ